MIFTLTQSTIVFLKYFPKWERVSNKKSFKLFKTAKRANFSYSPMDQTISFSAFYNVVWMGVRIPTDSLSNQSKFRAASAKSYWKTKRRTSWSKLRATIALVDARAVTKARINVIKATIVSC